MKTYYSRYRLDLLHHVEWNRTDPLHRGVKIPGSDGHSVAYLLKGESFINEIKYQILMTFFFEHLKCCQG